MEWRGAVGDRHAGPALGCAVAAAGTSAEAAGSSSVKWGSARLTRPVPGRSGVAVGKLLAGNKLSMMFV